MSDIAISAQNLSKHYTIGAAQQRHDTTSALLSTYFGFDLAFTLAAYSARKAV